MVRDPLTRRFKHLRRRLEGRHGILAIGSFGLIVSLSSVIWLSSSDVALTQSHHQPSLLELLDQVTSGTPKQLDDASNRMRPDPPESTAWRSPLTRQCKGIDDQIRKRLVKLKSSFKQQRERIAIDPSNYGKRYSVNPWKDSIDPMPRMVVLHETANSLTSAINTFKTPHPNDHDQVSYHTLIGMNGRVVDVVDPLHRAYGAGYSAFLGEWAVTNPEFMGSVNNFALHLSLETPPDGYIGGRHHSGYTEQQYDALALVLDDWMETFRIPSEAITTHQHVDLGGERGDPRSFNWKKLQVRMAALKRLC